MDSTIKVWLIKQVLTTSDIGETIATETKRAVWASVTTVYMSYKRYASEQLGFKPSMRLVTDEKNYDGESVVEVDGKRYLIKDTGSKGFDVVLYLEEQAGV